MNKYCLYYFPPHSGEFSDCLFVYFGGMNMTDRRESGKKVDKLFHKDILIGYIIKEFSYYCKIRVAGEVFLPNDEIIDLINDVLSEEGLDKIDYINESGFYLGKIVDKQALKKSFLYRIDIGHELYAESTFDLDKDDVIVLAVNETYLLPGRMIKEYEIAPGIKSGGRICSNLDLNIPPEDQLFPIVVEEKVEIGQDFFKVERRTLDA